MKPIEVQELSPEQGPLVGIALVAHGSIIASDPAVVSDGEAKLEVPLRFYKGNLNMIRAELQQIVDEAINALEDAR